MAKPWDKVKRKRGRKVRRLRSLHRYLIVCEDEKSSRLYLQSFPYDRNLIEVKPHGGCGETLSVVETGIAMKEEAKKSGIPYVETYCVIDRDDHPIGRYRKAFPEAEKHNDLRVIWANEAFELWYLLHFNFIDTGLRRTALNSKLAELLERKYRKNDDSIYQDLLDKTEIAIRNARQLEKRHANCPSPYLENPSTNVHHLIEVLQKLVALSAGDDAPRAESPAG